MESQVEIFPETYRQDYILDVHFDHGNIYEVIVKNGHFKCLYSYDSIKDIWYEGSMSHKSLYGVDEVVDHGLES